MIAPAPKIDIPDLNPGIRETVYWLRENGFNTCDSGDGKTHLMEGDREYAYVTIRVETELMISEANRLYDLLQKRLSKAGKAVPNVSWAFDGSIPDLPPGVQANYDPADGIALIELLYADDAMLGFR